MTGASASLDPALTLKGLPLMLFALLLGPPTTVSVDRCSKCDDDRRPSWLADGPKVVLAAVAAELMLLASPSVDPKVDQRLEPTVRPGVERSAEHSGAQCGVNGRTRCATRHGTL